MKRHFVLASVLLAGCEAADAPAAPPSPTLSKSPAPVPKQEPPAEKPIVRRSNHREEETLKPFDLDLNLPDDPDRGLIGFVSAPGDFDRQLKERLERGRPMKRIPAPGGGDATLYLVWTGPTRKITASHFLTVTIDREFRRVSAIFLGGVFLNFNGRRESGAPMGVGVRLGPLEKGSWTVELRTRDMPDKELTSFPFLAGPGGPEVKGVPTPVERKGESELPAFLITWSSVDPEHPLAVFVCREEEFESVRAARLGEVGGKEPAPFKSSDDLVLYVLWGRRLGWPDAAAHFDEKNSLVKVAARWTGSAGMKTAQTALYAGYGFRVGRRAPGEYAAEVAETTPVDPGAPKTTKRISFRVER